MMSCCRATPAEYLAEKLLDIEAFANHQLGVLEAGKLLHLREPGVDFDVFDRPAGVKVGVLGFEKENGSEYSVWFRSQDRNLELCRIDVLKASKKIAFQIANSLAQL